MKASITRQRTATSVANADSQCDLSLKIPGRIRNKAGVDDSAADVVLSLNIISAKNIESSHNNNRAPTQGELWWHCMTGAERKLGWDVIGPVEGQEDGRLFLVC
ncbi:kinesin-like protein KIF1B [Pelmatolapia mariae]|uniref:kinesin-like protein KIF1B n=1 Tax=Pelmatolapia mariae TaxID=158779 RepID=UPI003211CEB6